LEPSPSSGADLSEDKIETCVSDKERCELLSSVKGRKDLSPHPRSLSLLKKPRLHLCKTAQNSKLLHMSKYPISACDPAHPPKLDTAWSQSQQKLKTTSLGSFCYQRPSLTGSRRNPQAFLRQNTEYQRESWPES